MWLEICSSIFVCKQDAQPWGFSLSLETQWCFPREKKVKYRLLTGYKLKYDGPALPPFCFIILLGVWSLHYALFCTVRSIKTLLVCQSKKRERFKAQQEGTDLAQPVCVKGAASEALQVGWSVVPLLHCGGAVAGSWGTSHGKPSASQN